jgi:hypothetical protein
LPGLRRRRTAVLFRPKLQRRGVDLQRKHQPDLRLAQASRRDCDPPALTYGWAPVSG